MVCTPGLNCYSCPAAVMSCPIGALQMYIAGVKHSISLFVTGFLLSVGVAFGRFICGYVCPMGLVQDLLYKIKTRKVILKFNYARYVKYLVLIVFVMLLPLSVRHELSELGAPWFCKYICPSGMIFGAMPLLAVNHYLWQFTGTLFIFKLSIASIIIAASVLIYRPFCRILCPLGAIYALFNKIAFVKFKCDKEKCTDCGACAKACHIMLNPALQPNSPECVRCGNCTRACGTKALKTDYFSSIMSAPFK